jgi:hypothetical protein
MKVNIIKEPLTIELYGCSGVAGNKDYTATMFRLMDQMWKTVKTNELKNKGINIVVYESNEKVFAGVELNDIPGAESGLEHKLIHLPCYAYYKHVGSYNLLKQVGQNMRDELRNNNFETILPYIEIYGHWTNDESRLETELLMSLK